MKNIIGTENADRLEGTNESESIRALGGNDTIIAGGGDDFITPGTGDDSVDGGDGSDVLFYEGVYDGVAVNNTASLKDGLPAYSTLSSDGLGQDTFAGIEHFHLSNGGDVFYTDASGYVFMRSGNDTAYVTDASVLVIPGSGSDNIIADVVRPSSLVYSDDGYDNFGIADPTINAGIQVSYDSRNPSSLSGQVIDGWGDTDTFSGINRIEGTDLTDTMSAEGTTRSIRFEGLDGDDILTGGGGDDRLYGGDGNDTLTGGAGDDELDGGDGDDDLYGGHGNDRIITGSGNSHVEGGDGDDFIDVSGLDNLNYAWIMPGRGANTVEGSPDRWLQRKDGLDISYQDVVGSGGLNFNVGADGSGTVSSTITGIVQDTFSFASRFRGTVDNDTFSGSSNPSWEGWEGQGGDDTIDGGDGFDELLYHLDWQNGGAFGVSVNFNTGISSDAFGDTDLFTGIESVRGTPNSDTFQGSDLLESIRYRGLGGDDVIKGTTSYDIVDYSRDANYGGRAGISADLKQGEIQDGFGASDLVSSIDEVRGTEFADTMSAEGTMLSIRFEGLDGNDILTGGSGDDRLYGGDGNDTLVGGDGRDRLYGGSGDDVLDASTGEASTQSYGDYVRPGLGSDAILGHAELFAAGKGADLSYSDLTGIGGVSILVQDATGSGAVTNAAGIVSDTFTYVDYFEGSQDGDTIVGSSGAHWEGFAGLGGNDTIDGGSGSGDNRVTYDYEMEYFDDAGTGVDVNLLTGISTDTQGYTDKLININQVRGTHLADAMSANGTTRSIRFEGLDGDDTLTGGGGDDRLYGGDGNDTLVGGDGRDRLRGESGNDILDASEGSRETQSWGDIVSPGLGSDTILGHEAAWTAANNNERSSEGVRYSGIDLLYDDIPSDHNAGITVTFSGDNGSGNVSSRLSSNDTNWFQDTFTFADHIEGTQFDDIITGSNQYLEGFVGEAGNDFIDGGDFWNDTLKTGWDTIDYRFEASRDDDTPVTPVGVVVNLQSGVATDTFGDTDTLKHIDGVFGSHLDDVLIGNDRVNYLMGEDGNDLLSGGSGDDNLEGGAGNDTLDGGAGDDELYGGVGDDVLIQSGSGRQLYDGGDGIDTFVTDTDNFNGVFVPKPNFTGLIDLVIGFSGVKEDPSNPLNDQVRNVENVTTRGEWNWEIIGDDKDNVLQTGRGDDKLDGGSGNDTLTGGEGADTFVFRGVFDHDVITDFDATEDSLEFYSADGSAIAISELIDSTDTNGNRLLSTSDGLSSVILETINFSSLEISTTVTDRFGSALADADVSAYEIQVGDQVFLREVSTSDTSSVFEIVAKPTEVVSSVDFELLDNAGLIDFQVGSALNGWSIQSNTNTPDVVQFAGFGAINGSQDLVAGQETVLATFTTAIDPDFDISGIKLDGAVEPDLSVGEIPAASTNGNVTVFEVSSGTGAFVNAYKPIDEASEDAIGAYDALQALRLAVGLTKSDGTAEWHDYLAADINKDGRVGADDALDILKFAVGLTDGSSADWIFVDGDADWSGIDRRNTDYDEGIMLEDVLVDTSVNMMGILVGDLDGSYVA